MTVPPELQVDDVNGQERTSVVRQLSDGTNKRYLLRIGNMIAFARKVSPTVNGLYVNAKNILVYVLTNGKEVELSKLHVPSIIVGDGPPSNSVGVEGDVYIDSVSGDIAKKET